MEESDWSEFTTMVQVELAQTRANRVHTLRAPSYTVYDIHNS